MRDLPASSGSRRCVVWRGTHTIFVAILCIIVVFSCLDGATAQPTLEAHIGRSRSYYAPGDSVRYDQSLTGQYGWDIMINNGQTTTSGVIEVLTEHTFRWSDEMRPNSTMQENSEHLYRWDGKISDTRSMHIHLSSDLEAIFRPEFDSQRTISPLILDEEVTDQTLQVKVTPREGTSSFAVWIHWDETQEARAVPIPNTDQPRFNQPDISDPLATHSAHWKVGSPVNGREYSFTVQFRTENKLYPNKVIYKPGVHIEVQESWISRKLVGSTVTAEDEILGKVSFSTPSPRTWNVGNGVSRRVHYQQESAVWGRAGEYTTCKSIDQNGNPVDRSRDFLTADDTVIISVNLYELRVSVDVKFEWYAPDGSLYREQSVTTSSPPEGEVTWNYAVHDSIEVRGKPPSRMLGDWNVKVYVDRGEPIVAGFRIRRALSSISVSLSTYTVSQGETLLVTGKLQEAHEGVEIVLDYMRPDGSTVKRAVTTDPDGSFSDRYSPDMSGAWTVTASWEGNEEYEGTSAARGFTVTAAPSWMAALGGYSIFLGAVAVVVIVLFVLFWRRRGRRPPVAVKPVAAPPAAKGYCIFCAAPIEPEQEFCTQCGRRQIRIERPR